MPGPITAAPAAAAPARRRAPEGAHERRGPGAAGPLRAETQGTVPQESASDVVRWAAFSCVLVPVVLVGYGTSLAGAAGSALGLAAVTGVCRVLLRQSERGAERARPRAASGRRGTPLGGGSGGAPGRAARGAERAGRLTDSGALPHTFSANFRLVRIPWPNGGSTHVPPGVKGAKKASAPYVDRPLRRGALPCTARECDAS